MSSVWEAVRWDRISPGDLLARCHRTLEQPDAPLTDRVAAGLTIAVGANTNAPVTYDDVARVVGCGPEDVRVALLALHDQREAGRCASDS